MPSVVPLGVGTRSAVFGGSVRSLSLESGVQRIKTGNLSDPLHRVREEELFPSLVQKRKAQTSGTFTLYEALNAQTIQPALWIRNKNMVLHLRDSRR